MSLDTMEGSIREVGMHFDIGIFREKTQKMFSRAPNLSRRKRVVREEVLDDDEFEKTWSHSLLTHVEIKSNYDIRPLWNRRHARDIPEVGALHEALQKRMYVYPRPCDDVDVSNALSKIIPSQKAKALSLETVWETGYDESKQSARLPPLEHLKRQRMDWLDAAHDLLDRLEDGDVQFFYIIGQELPQTAAVNTLGGLVPLLHFRRDEEGRISVHVVGATPNFCKRLHEMNCKVYVAEPSRTTGDTLHMSSSERAKQSARGKDLMLWSALDARRILQSTIEVVFERANDTHVPRLISDASFLHGAARGALTASKPFAKRRESKDHPACGTYSAVLGGGFLGAHIPALARALEAVITKSYEAVGDLPHAPIRVDTGLPKPLFDASESFGLATRGSSSSSSKDSDRAVYAGGSDGVKTPFLLSGGKRKRPGSARKKSGQMNDEGRSEVVGAGPEGVEPWFTLRLQHHYRCGEEFTYTRCPLFDELPAHEEGDSGGGGGDDVRVLPRNDLIVELRFKDRTITVRRRRITGRILREMPKTSVDL